MSTPQLRAVPPPASPPSAPPPPADDRPEDDVQLSLWEHLDELRSRLRKAVIALVVGMAGSYAFSDAIYLWLVRPAMNALPEDKRVFYFSNPIDPIFVNLKVAALAGLVLAMPVILGQIWAFVSPGLYRRERALVGPFVLLGTLFFIAGGAFAYWAVMPYAFDYMLQTYQSDTIQALPDMGDVLGLCLMFVIAFGVIFEVPLLMTLISRIGIVSAAAFAKYRRWAIVGNVIFAAVITPTGDPFNLMLMAGPLMICYELGVVGARVFQRNDELPPDDGK